MAEKDPLGRPLHVRLGPLLAMGGPFLFEWERAALAEAVVELRTLHEAREALEKAKNADSFKGLFDHLTIPTPPTKG